MYLRRLTDLRESRNWTQTYVARLLHLQQRAYSRYEDGDRKIPLEVLIHLAVLYNVSVDYILELTDNPKPFQRLDSKHLEEYLHRISGK